MPVLKALPFSLELQWVGNLLVSFADQVNSALRIRNKLESCLVSGDGEAALLCLDEIDGTAGLSMMSLATRFAILQLSRGLDAQKEEYKRIRNLDVRKNVRFFSYWWSVRAEDSSSWTNFSKYFERRLREWDLAPELKAYIAFHVLRDLPASGEEVLLLVSSYRGSIIDIYEILLALTRTALIEGRPSSEELVGCCASLVGCIEDPRLSALLFLNGDLTYAARLQPAATLQRDAKLTGTVAPEEAPSNVVELLIAGMPGAKPAARGSLPERLAYATGEIAAPGSFGKGVAELRKLGAMFDHLPLGDVLRLMASGPRRTDRVDRSTAWELFGSSIQIQPESLAWVTDEQLRAFDEYIPGGLPSTPSWKWIQALIGHLPPADLETAFSSRARAELKLLHATSRRDAAQTLAAVSELDAAVGEATELALQAEIRADLSLNGLESALRICVDRLLARPELAAWMPLSMLAEQIEACSPPASNIDVPILLDYASKAGSTRFASARTYAAEDLLTARGALQPSDLASSIPPAIATDRDRYFFGQVCKPTNLKTSTLFGSERELETDRIAVCRWLTEADPVGAERFEEEARELVRSRHIRLGIQALQGSKLSIDAPGLRRWAERAVAEDFKRYMDLLEQGVFTLDDNFRNSVYAVLKSGSEAQEPLSIPDNEAASLFASVSTTLLREFALHPEHGLDAYLSLRIRHGTLSGHLRGPVEREHLITRKDPNGHYLKNDYWSQRLAEELDYDQVKIIDGSLQALSQHFDEIVADMTQDLIQVRREDKPRGLIITDPSNVTLALMIFDTLPDQKFDDFFSYCENMFWVLVGASAPQIAAALANVTAQVRVLFERAEERIREVAGDGAGPLKDAVLRARASVTNAIEDIRGWLAPPTTPASLLLSIEELIRVSLAVICGFYRDFAPKVEFDLAPLLNYKSPVRLFSDIFASSLFCMGSHDRPLLDQRPLPTS
jgi:hypothetical protein